MLVSQKAGLGGSHWAVMLAKDTLADPWEPWYLSELFPHPLSIHQALGMGCTVGSMTLEKWLSAAAAIPKGRICQLWAVGHLLPAPLSEQHWRGMWVALPSAHHRLCTRAWNHQVKKCLLAKSSDFVVWQGDRDGHNPFSCNMAITVIEVCLKCQHGFVRMYVEGIICNYIGFKRTFKTKCFEVCLS